MFYKLDMEYSFVVVGLSVGTAAGVVIFIVMIVMVTVVLLRRKQR